MCHFFSCISNGKGKIWYFDASMRQSIRAGEFKYGEDSHTSIADYYKSEVKEDECNKYEYNPLTGIFLVDQLLAHDDQGFVLNDDKRVEQWCRSVDFNQIDPNWKYVADLVGKLKLYKPINPIKAKKMPPIKRLRKIMAQLGAQVGDQVWAQVWAQVGDQVWAQVGAQVGDQVLAQVWDQVLAQVWDQVWAQVRDQVWDQVRDQVWDQVRAQVLAQVGAQVRAHVWDQVRAQVLAQAGIIAYYAVKEFVGIAYEHPAFDLIRLGVLVVNVLGKFKVFGAKGKFLGEFDMEDK